MNDTLKKANSIIIDIMNYSDMHGSVRDEEDQKEWAARAEESKTELLSLISNLVEENERKDIEIKNLLEASGLLKNKEIHK